MTFKGLLAALMFFTRLPFWRIVSVPQQYFKRVVEYWPITGWLTGATTAAVLWCVSHAFPMSVAVIAAMLVRVLVTGALHEDGLADFCDGFGGGTSRERVLAIMKDSHIGTYGVIGLIFYFITVVAVLGSLPIDLACMVIFAADPWSKFCASTIINFLPYARTCDQAKSKVVYDRMSVVALFFAFFAGALPLVVLPTHYLMAAMAPVVVVAGLIVMMRLKINGYTGDCCGATFLIAELSFFLASSAVYNMNL